MGKPSGGTHLFALISVSSVPIVVALFGVCVDVTVVAQTISLRTFRVVAGESRTAAVTDGILQMTVMKSARTTPPLEFPIRVLTEPTGLRLVIPPATPPGEYTVEIEGHSLEVRVISTALRVTVDAVTFSPEAVAARPPVILLNGFQPVCADTANTLAASVDTFGIALGNLAPGP
jgi:hypothetical protein